MVQEKRRLWKLILFSILTLGIYNIYFWFRFTQDINDMNREEKRLPNYILVLFLSIITLGIYRWVWFFWLADRVQVTGEQMGIKLHPGPGTTLGIRLFGTFIIIGPLISDILVIYNMNRIAREYNMSIKKKTKVIKKSENLPKETQNENNKTAVQK